MKRENVSHPSRRQVLKRVGGLTAAAVVGSASLAQAGTASATVADSKRFDLTDSSDEWFREILLNERRILQSFAFDNTNKHLYTAQLVQGGRTLSGESQAYSDADRSKNGDLCITRLDWQGNITGRMYLKGFGHGVSIGVEPSGSSAFLWTESDSVADSQNNGYGTKIARFKFANGAVLRPDSAQVTRYTPVAGSDHNSVAIDPVYNRIVHRYRIDGTTWKYSLYDLAAFKAGTFTPLATITQPSVLTGPTFQGYVSMGQYLYTLDGDAYDYDKDGRQTTTSNTYVTSIDWDGTVYERRLSNAGKTLFYREPEGLAIQIPNTGNPTAARLHLGFGSEESLSRTDKKASFYYKDLLV
ncbi:Tat pathway signal sequence domain protein [Streptomyces sp. SP2-10]|uniref:phage baseplate protein n=1 Tax=Streptomyces sp. SP2-10 TaxID=2873385 RepID=UPI001CA759BC|nr:Tat pathway signal sequence domain protein [Streptomyces sp. SP2-10]MBY8840447.1 Tat pathway signal sequence domain protein [Streptomyces sp. SP2-10]